MRQNLLFQDNETPSLYKPRYGALTISLLYILFTLNCLTAAAQSEATLIEISGQVLDVEKQEPLPDVSVQIKGTVAGTVTNRAGHFTLRTRSRLPLVLLFTSVGFQPRELEVTSLDGKLQIAMATQTVLGSAVVVTASRLPESILKSPVAIEKLDIRSIKEAAAPSFYDALENVKGVQMLTSSLTFKVPNTRGFNVPNNFRFLQLVDGVDMQAATLGVPLGNAIGATELDIEAVELTPGAASALYGMNAINGIANLQTKSPFKHQGLSIYQKAGVNHVDGIDRNPGLLTETALRYAKAFNNRLAFKINFSTLKGTDWVANGLVDQNPQNLNTANPRFPELSGENNPAQDQWSRYGDDRQARQAITVNYRGVNETFNVARTGYLEKDLIHPDVRNLKLDGGLFYKLNEKLELSYSYRYGTMDGVFQRGNRIQLKDVTVQNHKLELHSPDLLVRAYVLKENTGRSYNLNPLAYSLDLSHASNAVWGGRFKSELQKQLDNNVDLATAMKLARTAADAGRAEPGTTQFEALKDAIVNSNNWDVKSASLPDGAPNGGAAVWQYSNTYHGDFQYNLSRIKWASILVGADYRLFEVIPDGNTFVDLSRPLAERTKADKDGSFGRNQYYSKYGAFAQVTKLFFDEKLKVSASARLDHNPEFSPKFNPRIAAVYTAAKKHNFRASYQNGYRFPALFEALSFLNNASVRRVGGLARVNEGIGFLENSYTLTSLDQFTAAVNADTRTGMSTNDAALKNRALLQVASLPVMRPESINSFEVGYKSVLQNKLILDFDAYYNIYEGFLGQVEVSVPTSGPVGTDAAVQDMTVRAKQNRYRVYTNAKNTYKSYGSSLGVTYNFYKKFSLSGNANFNKLSKNPTLDIFLTGFNTPAWVTNISFSNREVVKNVGFNVVWRWQDEVLWESTLANGKVPSYSTFDAQVNVRVPKYKTTVKVGGSNILNNRYVQFAAGPTIGGLYYATVTLEGLLNK
jgi:outer membrane receptor protein involved in Fe transport